MVILETNPRHQDDTQILLHSHHIESTPDELAIASLTRSATIKKCCSGFLGSVSRKFYTLSQGCVLGAKSCP